MTHQQKSEVAVRQDAPYAQQEFNRQIAMQFIEMTGKTLLRIVSRDGDEPSPGELEEVGVNDDSIIRVNRQGDIEIRRRTTWDLIGGLLGDYDSRVQEETGLEWVEE